MNRRSLIGAAAALPFVSACARMGDGFGGSTPHTVSGQTVWTFDRLESIGGVNTRIEGQPRLINSPWGQAVLFDGEDDALFIDQHPLAGADTFTFEAIFRPDGGAFEQRWFHLQTDEAPDGPGTRILFEIRVVEGGWYLDAFAKGEGYNKALIFEDKLHPIGRWTHVAQTFDGRVYRSYVDGVLQGEAEIAFRAQGPGRSSAGVRINRVNYFKGAIREARFTPRALTPAQFTRG